jgi:hypothetical protein
MQRLTAHADRNRPKLEAMIAGAEEGDVVLVSSQRKSTPVRPLIRPDQAGSSFDKTVLS